MPSAVVANAFPKSARVRTRADYASAFDGARRLHGPLLQLVVNTAAGEAQPRLGIAVSRKTDPLATGRNRIKRIWRDTFRHERARLPALRYIAISKPPARNASNAELRACLLELFARAARLPVLATTGTMPADNTHVDSRHVDSKHDDAAPSSSTPATRAS